MNAEKKFVLGIAQTRFRKQYKADKSSSKMKRFFFCVILAVACLATVLILCLDISVSFDDGMGEKGEYVITNKAAYLINEPERGDVITFEYTDESGSTKVLQRRIIAFPGETVEMNGSEIYINGTLVSEDYIESDINYGITSVTVPTGCYYVLADNREEGPDSRDEVYVSVSSIIGEELIAVDFSSLLPELY